MSRRPGPRVHLIGATPQPPGAAGPGDRTGVGGKPRVEAGGQGRAPWPSLWASRSRSFVLWFALGAS